jgi:hypothetical protein
MGHHRLRAFAARLAPLPRRSAGPRLPDIERAPESELKRDRDEALAYDVNAVWQLLGRQPARGYGARGRKAQ